MNRTSEKCPVRASQPDASACPVDSSGPPAAALPTARETSSIPRTASENWVYPSEAQFFAAMARKQHAPRAADMRVVVPIHNAVNERAWAAVKAWEDRRRDSQCRASTLVTFKGRPGDRSPKAWAKMLLGYSAPFDRHDWVVDRCGMRIRYIIDFYTGRTDPSTPHHPSFYIDARPALDNWEGVRMRAERFWERCADKLWGASKEAKDGS